jgi:hypothetical protein
MPNLLHLLRLGVHSEQQYFINHKDKYDMVFLTANLAHYSSSGTASLMVGKLADKSFVIDPNTHVFGHMTKYIKTTAPGEQPKVKASLQGLGEEYGEPIVKALRGDRPVKAADFANDALKRDFTKRVLLFQTEGLIKALAPTDSKYIDSNIEQILQPNFLVAPYFFLDSKNYKEWLDVNAQLFAASVGHHPGKALYAEIVVDWRIVEKPDQLSEIISSYKQLAGCDGYLIWISNASEHTAGTATLTGLRRLVRELSSEGKPVINLYGGYFSLLLSHFGMSGVTHGPGYGEDRDVIPVGGGLPASKFYLTPIHQRLLTREVEFMVTSKVWENAEDFFARVCSGATCRSVINGNLLDNFNRFGREIVKFSKRGSEYSYPTPDARLITTNHYLEAKDDEFRSVGENSLQDLIRQLENAEKVYAESAPSSSLGCLESWRLALA